MTMLINFIAWLIGTLLIPVDLINQNITIRIIKRLIKIIGKIKVWKGDAQIFTNVSMDFDTIITWSSSDHSPFTIHSDQGDIFLMHGIPGAFQVGVTQPMIVELKDIGKWAPKGKAYWLVSCAASHRPHTILSHGSYFRNIPSCELGGVSALSPIGDRGLAIWASKVYDAIMGGLNVGIMFLKGECTKEQYIHTLIYYIKN